MQQGQLIDLVAPGALGLNTAQSGAILPPAYAVELENAVIDAAGRIAARLGWTSSTTTPISPAVNVETIHRYRKSDGTAAWVIAYNGGISSSLTDPEGSDISGSVTDTDGIWNFQNWANMVIGFQHGQKPVKWNGSGNFAVITESAGTAPTIHKGVGLCAFGRVWGLDSDGHTIKYSALLDETDWSTAGGGGTIDLWSVWTDGNDEVTALAAFNGALVVFGKRHIVFFTDGAGSELGIDPKQIYVSDVITGTGCVSWRTVQPVGETDLLFCSRFGVQALSRVIQEKSNPIATLSKLIHPDLQLYLADTSDYHTLASTFNPEYGFYLLSFPGSITFCFDQRRQYQDALGDTLSVITTWTLAPYALHTVDNTTYLGMSAEVGTYGGNTDDGAAFRFKYKSPWLDLGEELANRLKMLKRLGAILFVRAQTGIIYKHFVDFDPTGKSITRTVEGSAASEWGLAEWGEGEWAGGLALRIIRVPARNKGQYYQIAIEADVSGQFAVQQVELFTKIGRLA